MVVRMTIRSAGMRVPPTADVVVVGSGITGAATAAALTRRGATVVVLDKEIGPAREGSGRAQGSLRLQGRHPAEFELAVEALQGWARAAAEDPEYDVELDFGGNIYLCTEPDERPLLLGLVDQARASGLTSVEYLEAEAVRDLLPTATGALLGAMYSPVDAQCQPAKGTELFVRRARRGGATFVYGVKATRLIAARDRVVGVQTTAGRIDAGAVVVAAGAWTAHLLAGVGARVPILPVSMSELETAPLPTLFRPTVRAWGFGARQRPGGRLVVSAGLGARVTRRVSLYDLHGARHWLPRARTFRKNLRLRPDVRQLGREARALTALSPTLVPQRSPEPVPDRRSVDAALVRLARVFPAATGCRVDRRWAGLVDLTPDGLPVIDTNCGATGVTVVAGLSGHGLALGPVLGEIGADLALTGITGRPILPFALARFSGPVAAPEVMI
jgi:sarcosine oxidase subunit beta